MIFTTADIPVINLYVSDLLPFSIPSIEILMGTRCVTLVKLPEALLGGINENWDAVVEPNRKIFPVKITPS